MEDVQTFRFVLASGLIIRAWIEQIAPDNWLPRVAATRHRREEEATVHLTPLGLLPQHAAAGRSASQAFQQAWHHALAVAGRSADGIVEIETAGAHLVSIGTMRSIVAPRTTISLL